ncbi:LacI family DNA-binding transcriptional regulator [[Ruminococcus] torques]|nr:LacI family DNA-binding transcriptional regulator [[Ruminococcus] torques]
MTQNRVRIVDVADTLGLSTTTVSKVIHGKTEKISDKTVKRVQQELERSGYIPNMAGILLAGNNSRIIGVVVKTTSDIQIIGFDDNMASMESNPSLTTIHQEASLRAKAAIECLEAMHDGAKYKTEIVLPVDLMKRESTRKL